MAPLVVRITGQGWTRRAFAVAALLALLQPLLTPLAPDLAGWLPTHGHLYSNGESIPHSHPWDRDAPTSAPTGNVPAGFIFHPCQIHPDGLVPIGNSAAPTQAAPATDGASSETAADDVTFLFDLNLTGSILPAPTGPVLGCSGTWIAATPTAPMTPDTVFSTPTVPPPRAA